MLAFGGYELKKVASASPKENGFADRQAAEIGWRGYLPAVLSSQRNLLAEALEEEHRDLAELGVPTIAIWGEQDSVIPLSAMGKLAQWNRDAKQGTISGADHGLAVTHPEDVIDTLSFLLHA